LVSEFPDCSPTVATRYSYEKDVPKAIRKQIGD